MKRRLYAAALVLTATIGMTGCSGPAAATAPTAASSAPDAAAASATPSAAAPATAKPGDPTPPPPGSGVTGAVDPAWAAFEQSRNVVTSLLKGEKVSATNSMTPAAAAAVKATTVKDYMLGGRDVKTCQVNPAELKLQKPKAADHGRPFTSPDGKLKADARVSAVEVLCDSASFGFIVATLGPDHLVDGIEYRILPNEEVFLQK